jgi:hypothetical protein
MNWWQWAIVALTGLAFLGLLVYVRGQGTHILFLQARICLLRQQLETADRDPTHRRCRQVEQRLNDEITFLEEQARDRFDPVAEAQQILEQGGGS